MERGTSEFKGFTFLNFASRARFQDLKLCNPVLEVLPIINLLIDVKKEEEEEKTRETMILTLYFSKYLVDLIEIGEYRP